MFSFWQAAILGLVEGVTEFLPISSTGHLILAARVLGLAETEFLKSFQIIIQLGAMAAVVGIFFRRLCSIELLKRLLVAFLPTGILGLILYDLIKRYLLGNTAVTISMLGIGGLILLFFERFINRKHQIANSAAELARLENLPYKNVFIIGLCQAVAMVPGVSRSAATIVGAMLLGYDRKTAVEFSFLLALPTILAATGFDLLHNWQSFSSNQFGILLIGFGVAGLSAVAAVKWLLGFVRRHSFRVFGVYRIALAVAFWLGLK